LLACSEICKELEGSPEMLNGDVLAKLQDSLTKFQKNAVDVP